MSPQLLMPLPYCVYLCNVDVQPLVQWLAEPASKQWSTPPSPTKPQRIREAGLPPDIVKPILDAVRAHFQTSSIPWPNAINPMLGRMLPGQSHPMHTDVQRADWITRIHVPLITNPGAWHAFEEDGIEEVIRFHMEAGKAYTFNTLARHAFGNDGPTERIHLMFDVVCG